MNNCMNNLHHDMKGCWLRMNFVDHAMMQLFIMYHNCWSYMINIDRCIILWPLAPSSIDVLLLVLFSSDRSSRLITSWGTWKSHHNLPLHIKISAFKVHWKQLHLIHPILVTQVPKCLCLTFCLYFAALGIFPILTCIYEAFPLSYLCHSWTISAVAIPVSNWFWYLSTTTLFNKLTSWNLTTLCAESPQNNSASCQCSGFGQNQHLPSQSSRLSFVWFMYYILGKTLIRILHVQTAFCRKAFQPP